MEEGLHQGGCDECRWTRLTDKCEIEMATASTSTEDFKMTFTLSLNVQNHDSWGPYSSALLTTHHDIPYAPFSKADKLGRVADWYEPESDRDKELHRRLDRRRNERLYGESAQAYGAGISNAFSFVQEAEESSFSLVDRSSGAGSLASTVNRSSAKKYPNASTWGPKSAMSNGQLGGGGTVGEGKGSFGSRNGSAAQSQSHRSSASRGDHSAASSNAQRDYGASNQVAAASPSTLRPFFSAELIPPPTSPPRPPVVLPPRMPTLTNAAVLKTNWRDLGSIRWRLERIGRCLRNIN